MSEVRDDHMDAPRLRSKVPLLRPHDRAEAEVSTRLQVNAALERLAGKTILVAVVAGAEGSAGVYETLSIETTDGTLVQLETRDARNRESWLQVAK